MQRRGVCAVVAGCILFICGIAAGDAWGKVHLPPISHLYDLRSAEYLGLTDTHETLMDPGYCQVYSMMPYRVEGVRVTPGAKTEQPGDPVTCRVGIVIEDGDAGLHVFRVTVTDPNGRIPHYGTQITAPEGSGSAAFRLALNDTPGKWAITATDVATGVTGSTDFTVKR